MSLQKWFRLLIPPAFFLFTLFILAGTLLPSEYLSKSRILSYDKLMHIVSFGGWTALCYLYVSVSPRIQWTRPATYSAVAGTLFGVLIEILQYLLPLNRLAETLDIVANTIGCILFAMMVHYLKKRFSITF